ncbi:mitochondrial outer membrane translocase complex, subunit Tom5 [Bombardia bombarda]|uniref:Mitochondrial outer membrane translocase complex, subunit Tom5 n=1 Tax=Bombardia bombarda TaxID=252184 RepID=A0AA39U787_9PEZI|nr:mitochondrial outer membrane translocase complex, subunit Tom5 [Bombardia bombarda]
MFGGFQAPQPSAEDIRAAEDQATYAVQSAVGMAVALYFSPFLIDAVYNLF